MRLTLLEMGG
uniref:Uncharacterized protein n=1 Tax=Rhizophora mucronata TaxID=61149 RepID=A0A2P2NYD6_RHIMU